MAEPPDLLTTAEAIQYLADRGVHVAQDSLYRWATKPGAFPHSRQLPSRRWQFSPLDLDAALTSRAAAALLES